MSDYRRIAAEEEPVGEACQGRNYEEMVGV